MAITQPGGAGTIIYVYDDTNNTNHAAAPGAHTWAEIAAAFPADFVSNGSLVPEYKSAVNVQIGDAGVGAATTTIQDATDATVSFNNTFTLSTRTTQVSSWFLTLGTKIGSGNRASGINGGSLCLGAATTLRGTVKLYGCKIRQTTGALTWNSNISGSVGEAVNCMFQSTSAGTAPFVLGAAGFLIDNMFNVDFSHTTAAQMASNFFVTNAELISCSASAPTTFFSTGSVSFTAKDLLMLGSPTQSDLRIAAGSAISGVLVRPRWTQNAPKFSAVGIITIAVGSAWVEYWLYNAKCVDGTGTGVTGIPLKITDAVGNVVLDTVTTTNGETSFGSGVTANSLPVMDHYTTAGVYQQRHRSPFLVECNMSYQTGYNNNYFSHRYYMNWPGKESITTNSGTFEDFGDVIPMSAPASGGSTWIERIVP